MTNKLNITPNSSNGHLCPLCDGDIEVVALKMSLSGVIVTPDGFDINESKQQDTEEEWVRCTDCDWEGMLAWPAPSDPHDDEFILRDFSVWASHSGILFDEADVYRKGETNLVMVDGDDVHVVIVSRRMFKVNLGGAGWLKYKEV